MFQRLKKGFQSIKPKYILVELLLLIVGINVGLWFNNLNEKRKERALENKILIELKASLESDMKDAELNYRVHEQSYEACNNVLSNKKLSEEDLSRSLFSTLGWTYLIADLSAYESLKSIGFQLIEEDSLRRRMIKLYNVHYQTIYQNEKIHKIKRDNMAEKLFSLVTYSDSVYTMNALTKKQIQTMAVDIKRLMDSNDQMKLVYNEVLPEIDTLLVQIKNELE